jgi:uncharacterized protein
MAGYMDEIAELEKEVAKTKYNKRTQKHIGLVKAKIAMLKEKERGRSSGGKKGKGYSVRKSGDASVIMIGFPSAGKSTLLNVLTGADSPVGAYEFTTLDVIPGMMTHKHAQIQLLDVPGIVRGAAMGRGRGKEVLAVIQSANLVLYIIDVFRPHALAVLEKEVYDAHVRVNVDKPDVKIIKKSKGGVGIGKTVKCPKLDNATIEAMMRHMKLNNVDIVIRSPIDVDGLIDAIEGNKKYVPGLIVLNKIDAVTPEDLEVVKKLIKPDICISASKGLGTDKLKDMIYDKLDLMRIFCKEVGKKADMEVPLIVRKRSTIREMCTKLHKDFVLKFTFAKVWGKSVKHDGQKVMKLRHVLKDKDIVEIHLK